MDQLIVFRISKIAYLAKVFDFWAVLADDVHEFWVT